MTVNTKPEHGVAVLEGEFTVVRPLASTEDAIANWNAYQDLTRRLLVASDWQTFREGGKEGRFVKKSGWRRLATHYGISIEMVDERLGHDHDPKVCARIRFPEQMKTERDCGCGVSFARYVVKAIAPNGRSVTGIGICSTGEKNRRFTRQDHDIATTSWTRAVNRAVSDMIGAGEVSAEEVRVTGAVRGLPQEDREAIRNAWVKAGVAARDRATEAIRSWGFKGAERRELFSDFDARAQDDQVAELLNVLAGDDAPFDPDLVPPE
ncbi:MAG: hypothetical protein M3O91_09735 [Chloroflexota bacterium]|nr:hypothetical protein [Chloroflexota bacterium]